MNIITGQYVYIMERSYLLGGKLVPEKIRHFDF